MCAKQIGQSTNFKLMKAYKVLIILGVLCSLFGVVIGAFGAHGLENILAKNGYTSTFETGVKYQFYHSFGLILIGFLLQKNENKLLLTSGMLMFLGILLFSFSLYVLAITGIKYLGIITPFGGVLFVVSWILLLIYLVKYLK